MGYAVARTVSVSGATGHLVDVGVDVSNGQVATAMVGRPDTAISEARDRCRSALINSGFDWPGGRRVTILLSPADLPKRGPHFDLAIALAVLSAAATRDTRPEDRLDIPGDHVFLGELSLDGRLRSVPGVLPMVIAAARRGHTPLVVPEPQVPEAVLVPGMTVIGARSLEQVVSLLREPGTAPPPAPPVEPLAERPLLSWRGQARLDGLDLADVRGSLDAKFALEVAAAGGHHLLLVGPKGAGKTMLAERLPGLLPDLSLDEALEVTAIHSLAGRFPPGSPMLVRPMFCAPHHSSSRTSVLGGGNGRVLPGEVSRAHLGVLFLDEFPLFRTDVIEGLREPLENGDVYLARAEETATFPALAQVVLAANQCPCGDYVASGLSACACSERVRRHYRAKLAGPVADRIDITRTVTPPVRGQGRDPLGEESSATVRRRVTLARARQAARYAERGWRLNAHVPGPALEESWPLPAEGRALIETELGLGRLTRRGAVRAHRVALTIADLRGADLDRTDVEIALQLRQDRALDVAAIRRHVEPAREAG